MSQVTIDSNEIVIRHIPGGTYFQAPGPRVTSSNFVLRDGETGVSVSRASLTTPESLMTRIGNPATGSLIASAGVAEIRSLGLDVVEAPIPEDPGHAEIREVTGSFSSRADRKRLAELFQFIESASQGT